MKLYKHQEEALRMTEGKNRVAYYHDMGLGKTFTGSEKMMELGACVNLVICQKSKISDWVEHFHAHYMRFDAKKCRQTFDLTDKNQMIQFQAAITSDAACVIGVINYELAWRRPELLRLRNFTLMLDESSLIQNRTAKQTKFILKLQPVNVVLLSGTPCSGKYENLWTQAKLLGWDIPEKTYLEHYVNRKLMDFGGARFWKVLGYKNVERLKEKFREHGAVFLKTEEVLDLPQQTFIDVSVSAPKEYRKFMKDCIVQIDGQELIGDTALTKRLRARQICSIYNKAKYDAFEDLLKSTNDRLIVFYNFTEELARLMAIAMSWGRPCSVVNGFRKTLEEYESYDDSVTFVQYQAGAKGLNLQKANKLVYFSLTEKCDDWMQSQKRIHRIGQDRPCFYYILKCKGTVEEKIHAALLRGEDYTDELFRKECC